MPIYTGKNSGTATREDKPIIYVFSIADKSKILIRGEYAKDDIVETVMLFQGGDLSTGKVVEGIDNSLTKNRQEGFVLKDFLKNNIVLLADPNMDFADKPTFTEVREFYAGMKSKLLSAYIASNGSEPYPTNEYVAIHLMERFELRPFNLPEDPTKEGHGQK